MDRSVAVVRALEAAAPGGLVDVLAACLREHYGAGRVELRLVDYGMRSLQPVQRPPLVVEPLSVDGTPQGRAFDAQEPHTVSSGPEEREVHLPVTVRGDRLGVLSVTVPGHSPSPAVQAELHAIATALGREILLAGRETDEYEVQRRAERLTLAAELQWLLLPGRSCARDEFALGAHLEPAYAVFGDGFDWSVSPEHLSVAVINGMGRGMDAALLTGLVVNAVRNARRAGLGLADQAALADEAVFAQYRGTAHAAVLLLRFELATGRVEAVDAGSPRLWRMRAGEVERLELEPQLPLGMFGDTPFETERVHVAPGDRLLIASDGVYTAATPAGEAYGERKLARTMKATRLLPPAQVPAAVLRELSRHLGHAPLEDDAVVMCLDWAGRPDEARPGAG
jgi:serine phosphatase RsbU (regulator of sigma subunit)